MFAVVMIDDGKVIGFAGALSKAGLYKRVYGVNWDSKFEIILNAIEKWDGKENHDFGDFHLLRDSASVKE